MVSVNRGECQCCWKFEKYDLRFNGTKFLRVVIWFVEEHEVAMAPAFRQECFFTDFELFQFYSGRTNKL